MLLPLEESGNSLHVPQGQLVRVNGKISQERYKLFPVGFIIQTLTDEIIIIILLWMNGGSIKFYCMEIKKLIPLFDEI